MTNGTNLQFSDLRSYLGFLEENGKLLRVKEQVDSKCEIAAILYRLGQQRGPAVLFENVKDHDIPVVGAVYGTLDRVASGIGTTVIDYAKEVSRRFTTERKPPVFVEKNSAPIKAFL